MKINRMVKVIEARSSRELEKLINTFISTTDMEVIEIKYSITNEKFTVLIELREAQYYG
ncbi:hypothetical protein SYNTR_1219 [Candidatus Syntrophocurvum alkaliphilum]|uniref:Uncharacterized protein n=1 Tax=Candidatus Syntrophocurvum alkaliphilum TaxID=2293317 RepID=A0A6I6DFW0_9FIRM|nr:hypothetical protein [Candidatus Syntrophocurvum alkaliphilum]QGT99812.1 hypothetical protein SYNTR_1219 [Candidatus Syntrophocurvum alkaliphilum]